MSYTIGDGIVTLALAAGIVGYLQVIHRSRQKRIEIIHQERMAAMEKGIPLPDRKSTRLNSSHLGISYAVFCLKKKKGILEMRDAVGMCESSFLDRQVARRY